MKTTKRPLKLNAMPLFQFEKKGSALFGTTHPTTITITTSSTGLMHRDAVKHNAKR